MRQATDTFGFPLIFTQPDLNPVDQIEEVIHSSRHVTARQFILYTPLQSFPEGSHKLLIIPSKLGSQGAQLNNILEKWRYLGIN